MDRLEIKVFGEQTKQITEGDIFIASVDSVEGRTVVTLSPKKTPEQIIWERSMK